MRKKESNYHLYYRLPWRNAIVGLRVQPKYTVLRSDTEKVVAYCNTQQEAETMCDKHNKTMKCRVKKDKIHIDERTL